MQSYRGKFVTPVFAQLSGMRWRSNGRVTKNPCPSYSMLIFESPQNVGKKLRIVKRTIFDDNQMASLCFTHVYLFEVDRSEEKNK